MSNAEEEVKVLTSWLSPFGNRVLIALEEIGVAYHSQQENLGMKSRELLEANPVHKKVPVLVHNAKPICESLIILEYIDETWSSSSTSARKSILPSDPYDRAIARFWANFIDNKFWNPSRRVLLTKEESQEESKIEILDALLLIEGALETTSAGKPYFGGENFGYLDIAFAPFIPVFQALETLGNFKLPLERCPNLRAWIELVSDRESVQKILPQPQRVTEFFRARLQK